MIKRDIDPAVMADAVYYFLIANCRGEGNGIPRPKVAEHFNITPRDLRRITKEINTSPKYEKLVSTTHSCYICDTERECEKTLRNTYRVAVALFKKAKQMERKVGLNGQFRIKLGDDFKDIVETFEE